MWVTWKLFISLNGSFSVKIQLQYVAILIIKLCFELKPIHLACSKQLLGPLFTLEQCVLCIHATRRLQAAGCGLQWKTTQSALWKKCVLITAFVRNLHVHKHCCRCKYLITALKHIRYPSLALLTRPAEFPIITTVKATSQVLQSF